MKRMISLLLSLLMLLALCACGATEDAPAPAATEAVSPTPVAGDEGTASDADTVVTDYPENAAPVEQPNLDAAPTAIDDDQIALLEQFLQIDSLVHPGTAGSSLSTAVAAASLLDWAESATLTPDSVEVVLDYMTSMTDEGREEFSRKLDAVEAMVETLTGSDQEAARQMLSDAGMLEGCAFPWSKTAPATVKALMQSIGRA